jgi:hypothetical protein
MRRAPGSRILFASMMLALAASVTAAPAHATTTVGDGIPYSCRSSGTGNTWSVQCSDTGSTRYRAAEDCQGRDGPYKRVGPWVRTPEWSGTYCLNNEHRIGNGWTEFECAVICAPARSQTWSPADIR